MKNFLWIAVVLLLAGCGTAKPAPEWLSAGHSQLSNYKKHYLGGQDKIAALEFNDALKEVKKSGDLEVLGRSYLIRMALQTAALQDLTSAEYQEIQAVEISPANENFYAFLQGKIEQVDEKLLPEQYHSFVEAMKKQGASERLQAIERLDDPLARLIAVGILVRLGQETEALLQKAIATASTEGWKKALVAYLTRLQALYDQKQESSKARAVQQRLKLIVD